MGINDAPPASSSDPHDSADPGRAMALDALLNWYATPSVNRPGPVPPGQRLDALAGQLAKLGELHRHHANALFQRLTDRWRGFLSPDYLGELPRRPPTPADTLDYAVDTTQRGILFLDVLRQRGNQFLEYEAHGQPPLLAFDYEVVIDGRTLPSPVNYCLVRILPPHGVKVDPRKRPYLIVDPRAGHGAGIGGFKPESQVGVALREGNPVYFVVFYPVPEPGQTLRAIATAESRFVREVANRHPDSPKPCVIGNCQGGWAVMGLAATDPDITGPIVLNGAPLSYWSGKHGKHPMRYFGGLAGGGWPAYLASDLGNGLFDGAWLVQNFEALNPGNTLWSKYYHLYAHIDTEVRRFLDFEKWWGGFVLMNRAEMRGIVDDLFVGNKLATGGIPVGRSTMLDLRQVRSPIVVFCSHGDDITPPQQALNWISDTYLSSREIKAHGQTIVYIIHEDVGHLGIFVSGSVVRREFSQIASTLGNIESLPPGLYELVIEDAPVDDRGLPQYHVRFEEREIEDILAHDDNREDERYFQVVAALSELNGRLYELLVSPVVQTFTSDASAHWMRRLHPMRAQRYLWSDLNPALAALPYAAGAVSVNRRPAHADNPWFAWQNIYSDTIVATFDTARDIRDAWLEGLFHSVYGTLDAFGVGERLGGRSDTLRRRDEPTAATLATMTEGGLREAVLRMLLLMMRVGGSVRRDTVAYVQERLTEHPAFAEADLSALKQILGAQSTLIAYEPERALQTLPQLLKTKADRREALRILQLVIPPDTLQRKELKAVVDRFYAVLEQPLPVPEAPVS